MSSEDNIQRTVLPIPDQPRKGLILYDAKDPERLPPDGRHDGQGDQLDRAAKGADSGQAILRLGC
jgi:hypothetical protein